MNIANQLHLCHIDSCPNIVIEGLCCGLNVLCSNLGGTQEIVGENGVVLRADKMWSGQYLPKTNLDNIEDDIWLVNSEFNVYSPDNGFTEAVFCRGFSQDKRGVLGINLLLLFLESILLIP